MKSPSSLRYDNKNAIPSPYITVKIITKATTVVRIKITVFDLVAVDTTLRAIVTDTIVENIFR